MARRNTNIEETVTEVVTPTTEERILGEEETVTEVVKVNYTALKRRYKVKNVRKNRVYELNGYEIGAILGNNEDAKKQLREGKKKIEIIEPKTHETLYNIEVLK